MSIHCDHIVTFKQLDLIKVMPLNFLRVETQKVFITYFFQPLFIYKGFHFIFMGNEKNCI